MEHVRKVHLVDFLTTIIIPNNTIVPCRYPPSSQDHVFWEVWAQALPSPEDGSQLGEAKDS